MQEMTVAEGMQELKLIVKKLNVQYQQIKMYSSKKAGAPDAIEKQRDYVAQLRQSTLDLIRRYINIKLAIQQANLTMTFEFNGKKYTVAEAIMFKQETNSTKNYYEMLWASFTDDTAKVQLMADRQVIASLQNDQEKLKALNLVPELYYDPKEILEQRIKLAELLAAVNTNIDKCNHATKIQVP